MSSSTMIVFCTRNKLTMALTTLFWKPYFQRQNETINTMWPFQNTLFFYTLSTVRKSYILECTLKDEVVGLRVENCSASFNNLSVTQIQNGHDNCSLIGFCYDPKLFTRDLYFLDTLNSSWNQFRLFSVYTLYAYNNTTLNNFVFIEKLVDNKVVMPMRNKTYVYFQLLGINYLFIILFLINFLVTWIR